MLLTTRGIHVDDNYDVGQQPTTESMKRTSEKPDIEGKLRCTQHCHACTFTCTWPAACPGLARIPGSEVMVHRPQGLLWGETIAM